MILDFITICLACVVADIIWHYISRFLSRREERKGQEEFHHKARESFG